MEKVKYKVLAVSGSPREKSNTDIIINEVLLGAKEAGHSVKYVKLNSFDITPCQACNYCREKPGRWCKLKDEGKEILDMTLDCDVLVFGSPVYMGGISAQAKAYIDRWYSFKDKNRITKLDRDRQVVGVYAHGARQGKYHRLFELMERLFNSNNFAYLGSLVTPDYKVPRKGSKLLKKAYSIGFNLK